MTTRPADGRAGITVGLVERLIDAQFPQWAGLTVTPVDVDGWDNRTYRLGPDLSVRLPTAAGYVPAVAKESRWLPRLATSLPVAVPSVLAVGVPGQGYPFPWSVRGWLPGETASRDRIEDLSRFAVSLAEFLVALRRCDPRGGPPAGEHSFYRGCSPASYDVETRRCLAAVGGLLDDRRAGVVWEAALAAGWTGEPVWFHGDISAGNLLVRDGWFSAVLDFGTSGVGDPACDLVVAWTLFEGDSRDAFRATVQQDEATWARARGWALWKALLGLTGAASTDPGRAGAERRVILEVLVDHG